MLTRLWFILSLAWAIPCLYGVLSAPEIRLDAMWLIVIFGPFIAGLLLKAAGRYVVTGRLRSLPRVETYPEYRRSRPDRRAGF